MSNPGDRQPSGRAVPVSVTRTLRVLVVEDDPTQQTLYSRALTNKGFDVECMSSGFGLVNKVAGMDGDRPDVVVLDHNLPALTGSSLLGLLAKHPEASKVPVLLHTAADGSEVDLAGHPRARFVQKEGVKRLLAAVNDAVSAAP